MLFYETLYLKSANSVIIFIMKMLQEFAAKFCRALLILGLVLSSVSYAGDGQDKKLINNGNPVEHIKDDENGYKFLGDLIAAEAVDKGEAKEIRKAQKDYRKYAKKLAKVLGQHGYSEQQLIFFGSL